MNVLRLIAACLSLTVSTGASAQPAPGEANDAGKIYATAWGMTLAEDGSGFYNDLARLILDDIANKPGYDLIPYRRANRIFAQDKSSCHYPSTLNYMAATGIVDDTSDLVESYFMLRSVAHIFSRYDTEPVTQKADVSGKVIAYPMGAEVPRLLDGFGASFIPVNAEKSKAELLISGRVELMIGYMPDVVFVFRELGKPLPPFDPNFTINDDNIAIVCHRTPGNEALIARVNDRITSLRESGALAAFLSENGIDPLYYLGALERKSLGH